MRRILFILSIFLLASPVLAQEPCDRTVAQAPSLLNLKLGMSVGEVNSVIGRDLKVKVKPEGERTFFKNYIKKRAKRTLEGVRAIFLSFNDGRLYQIELFYQEDHRWADLDSVLRGFGTASGFSADHWAIKNGYAEAQCDGFSLAADHVLGAHIELTDDAVLAEVEAARKKN